MLYELNSSEFKFFWKKSTAPGFCVPESKYRVLVGEVLTDFRELVDFGAEVGAIYCSENPEHGFVIFEISSELAMRGHFLHLFTTSAVEAYQAAKSQDAFDVDTCPLILNGLGQEANNYKQKAFVETLIYERFFRRVPTIVFSTMLPEDIARYYGRMTHGILNEKYMVRC